MCCGLFTFGGGHLEVGIIELLISGFRDSDVVDIMVWDGSFFEVQVVGHDSLDFVLPRMAPLWFVVF